MRLKEITAQGFKCFNQPVSFDFDLEPGLFYLTGENQVEPNLGANGVGKSSLFDAWTYLLFAKTARGLKAGDVYAWKSKLLCKIEGSFYLGEELFVLKRTWNPNTLEMKRGEEDFKEVTQEQVESLVEFTFDSWLAAVLMDQQGDKFMDMSAPDKTAMFSTILGLDYWLECSKRASEQTTFMWDILRDTESLLSRAEGQLEEAQGRSFEEAISEWNEEHQKELDSLKTQMSEARGFAQKHRKALEKYEKQFAELGKEKDEAKEGLKEKKSKLEGVGEKIFKWDLEIQSLQKDVETTENQVVKWDKLQGECPHCNQVIDAKHKKKEVAALQKKLEDLDSAIEAKEDCVKKAEKTRKAIKGEVAELRQIIEEIEADQAKIFRSKASLEAEAKSMMKEAVRLRSRYEEVKEAENPYVKAKMDHEKRVKILEDMVAEQKRDVTATKAKHDALKFWVKGFKEVRYLLIKEALLQFEIEVNSSLQSLGLGDWKMSFAMDEENKSGTIKKGFSVSVKSPHNKEKVKWEAWSGGEAQRLRLAASMGLINLILSRRSYDTNIEIWDEPTQHLSEKGVYDLLDTINNRAELLGKQIWIVDHSTLCYANFKRSFKMIKTVEGSKLEEFN